MAAARVGGRRPRAAAHVRGTPRPRALPERVDKRDKRRASHVTTIRPRRKRMLSFGGGCFTLMELRFFFLFRSISTKLHAVVINGGCLYRVLIRSNSTFYLPMLHCGERRIDLDHLCFLKARRTLVGGSYLLP